MSNFQGVHTFNKLTKSNIYNKFDKSNFDNNKLKEFRYSLIKEEFEELRTAMDNYEKANEESNDDDKELIKITERGEIVDALCDILYVTYGYLDAMGIDGDKSFSHVQKSNMSKFDDTEEDAQLSKQKYLDIPDEKKVYKTPDYKYNEKEQKYIIYNTDTSKILKSKNFTTPDFRHLEEYSK